MNPLQSKRDWMYTLDISFAFNHIRVKQLLQQYLAFQIQGTNYIQVGMPFGVKTDYTTACYNLTKLKAKVRL
ncbi:MAG: hypothetical protein EZS28_035303 [Streblomastix strix]|uniref:Reverse transcriptase domain-containing protein n=1 Tax=Streblomastix strix TaxID=222440 RepID=A0A5J4UGI6_9EUKA|nr:MAG: hypothetical protein EZS28_035303 [Streblomastix strix]